MDLTEYSIRNRTISWMVVLLLIGGGFLAFNDLGRLEDPNFTIKQAIILLDYPGASALEVEEEVTLPVENALQQLSYLDNITSTSSNGLAQIMVEMKSIYRKDDLAQIWDEMRRKIHDMQGRLPPGVSEPRIIDDFGDVYGMFLTITGQDYSYEELADYTDYLRRELVLVPGVGKVNVGGRRQEQVFIEADRAKLTATGFAMSDIQNLLRTQNLVGDAGKIRVGSEYLRISSKTEDGDGLSGLANMLIGNVDGQLIYLQDVATISKSYADPPAHLYRFNGQSALTLGISFASGVNVVKVGEAIDTRLAELEGQRPVGMLLGTVYDQPGQVAESVDNFLISLGQAVLIVILVLLFTMGLKPGILMSSVLMLTILGTFIVMDIYAIELHRISLGALIIALGMLVDNAIVVTEGIMIGLQRGQTRLQAAKSVVGHTKWPLMGATIISITAFAPIGLSPDASGEFTGSLFWVLLISLLLSWIFAITLTPFFCYLMFKEQRTTTDGETGDPYRGFAYQGYRVLLQLCLRFRWLTMTAMLAALIAALAGFTQVKQAFFPASSLPMFMVEYWLPEGSDIRAVNADIQTLEQDLQQFEQIQQITATIGRGAERFMLTYSQEFSYPSYAQLIIRVENFDQVQPTIDELRQLLNQRYPQAFTKFQRFTIGPSTKAKIEARLIGPDPQVLRRYSEQVIAVFEADPDTINVRQDWRERTKVLQPVYNEAEGRRLGISKSDLDTAVATHVEGETVGLYRHGTKLLPIVIRPPATERASIGSLEDIQVYSPAKGAYVNIGQVMERVDLAWEDPLIKRRDRKRTLSVQADPIDGMTATTLHNKIRGKIEAIELPPGYELQWGGEYETQRDANKAVFAFVPLGVLVMIVLTVVLFGSAKQALVVWITVPLSVIGVTIGLLVMDSPFSFMALLAVLSLVGMQLKNGIVLVEEIKRLREDEGQPWLESITQAAISRLRPVTMAAITTVLGMLPLLSDVFFQPMAVTIMFGLGFATLLTLIVVPVLFALFYGVRYRAA
ncbi:AcrB/AcrD/AcrF family protein [Motiliproteus coralliicola]|uniref:AcrB/AcrD/AcrF family protein n=1 Tax=Motiliproteus coralliicola TaxID=2283196 RepID=A0A369WU66_9GAMM|nr:efflux RND transporter permease subunit [Motiliproteus coralliicola]RDE25212.1 AcrB/AcrD/AcrF family protein [Motiliproteus coralliicola]